MGYCVVMKETLNAVETNQKNMIADKIALVQKSFTDEQWENLLEEVESALLEFEFEGLRGKHASHWNYLRIWPDGKIVAGMEASPYYPESEYYGRVPHPITIQEKRGDCYFPDADIGWDWKRSLNGHLIAPWDEKYGFTVCENYEVVQNLSAELIGKLAAGWKRFELDFENWLPDNPEIDQELLKDLAEWADENFRPAVTGLNP